MKLDILAIAVHPDDVELGCSGALMLEKSRGKKTGVLDLTRGELGTRGTPELREQEAIKAALVMEIDIRENALMADGFFVMTRPISAGLSLTYANTSLKLYWQMRSTTAIRTTAGRVT